MANDTANYGLHQWEPGDSFLRTDFNEDHAKIDTALGRAERSGQANAYNVYNLMLQNYYEGKYTGYKKALLFDGFLDEEGIAEKSEAVYCYDGAVRLRRTPAAAPGPGYGNDLAGMNGTSVSKPVTAPADCRITGYTFRAMYSNGSLAIDTEVQLQVNGGTVSTARAVATLDATRRAVSVSFTPVRVRAGDTLTVRVSPVVGLVYYVVCPDGREMGGQFSMEMSCARTAKIELCPAEVEAPFTQAMAWVRYTGGAVGLSLGGTDMAPGTLRETADLRGGACTEASFHWSGALSGPVAAALSLDCGADDAMAVYDYGVVLL